MHIDAAVVRRLEAEYGVPRRLEIALPMTEREFALCKRAAARGRPHDVTLFVLRSAERGVRGHPDPHSALRTPHSVEVALIRKWSYPPDLFRPPSGGVEPGEPFETGAAREAWEETGLKIALERYLVRANARFEWQGEELEWTTHLFSARWVGGEIGPVDTREIAEARWATVAELDGEQRARMLATGSPGFRYRVALHDAGLAQLGMKAWEK